MIIKSNFIILIVVQLNVTARFLNRRAQKYGFIFRILAESRQQDLYEFSRTFSTMMKVQSKKGKFQQHEKGTFPNFILQKVDYEKLVVFDQPQQEFLLVDRCDFFKTYGLVWSVNFLRIYWKRFIHHSLKIKKNYSTEDQTSKCQNQPYVSSSPN